MLVHAKEKSVWETCLCVALLRAEVKEPSHRVASDQGRQECGIERRTCSSVVREGCREAELQGGCGMLVVEAMVVVVVGCSLFSPLSPLSPRSLPTLLNGA
jgi:hypothetical protein